MSESLLVVVAYNNRDLTMKAVSSALAQGDTRVLVWDNASTDGTDEVDWGDAEYHRSDENLLWSPAINRAVELYWSGEKYLGFMNNDLWIPPCAVERMTSILEDESVGMVGPVGSGIGGPHDFLHRYGPWTNIAKDHFELQTAIQDRPPRRATYLVGTFTMLRHSVWQEVGPLDESMPLGADDHDYSIRLKAKGYKLMVADNVFVEHASHASESTEGGKDNWTDWGARSWDAFNEKYRGYYETTEEAALSHWGGDYHEGFDR